METLVKQGDMDSLINQDWNTIQQTLHDQGFAVVKRVLTEAMCKELIADYQQETQYRKTVNMERYRFGKGEYKYFSYPLPPLITTIRSYVYEKIAPVANSWMKELNIATQFPATHDAMLQRCHEQGQTKPTVLILSYTQGGFNTLHQDLYGEVYFPMQVVFVLDQAEEDFTGGEFVLTEQLPRAQSKANVLRPDKGDMVIFTTNFRPASGTRGYYRVNMKHGVSPLHSGQRHSLGIIFHDALS
jgi:uncharacterized protein